MSVSVRALAPSELEIMRILWAIGPATVRTVHALISRRRIVTYTTTMTTMARMAKKGIPVRERLGRGVRRPTAYRYVPAIRPADLLHHALVPIFRRFRTHAEQAPGRIDISNFY
jgi:predicted transcriptional regulator